MRLTLIICDMAGGGAQRVLSIMANYWAKKGWHVTILTFEEKKNIVPFYDLHPAIIIRPLELRRKSANIIQGLINNFKRILVLRQAMKSTAPKMVISFMEQTNVLVVLSKLKLNLPVFICQHSDPKNSDSSGLWKIIRNFTYRGATQLIVLTKTAQSYFSPSIQRHTVIIPNPVLPQNNGKEVSARNKIRENENILVAMGRLGDEKGFDLLLKAFARISSQHPEWSLVIWGEGDQRSALEKISAELGLVDKVRFPGLTTQPYEKLKESDFFVLSSRTEAFPMVLVEAMACGLPVISFDCPSGPLEIIRDGIDGILVPPENVEALAAAMDRLMGDKEERDRLAMRAPDVIERFGLEKVMTMWDTLIKNHIVNNKYTFYVLASSLIEQNYFIVHN